MPEDPAVQAYPIVYSIVAANKHQPRDDMSASLAQKGLMIPAMIPQSKDMVDKSEFDWKDDVANARSGKCM